MGCGSSSDHVNTYVTQAPIQPVKSTCLIFGMPDSGQDLFVNSIENCFASISGGREVPFEFVVVGSDRNERSEWLNEFSKHKRVIISFFFLDISSRANVLNSVRTLNWLRCQIDSQHALFPVAYVKTDEDIQNFQQLKEILGESVEVSTFNDENPSDSRIYSEHIISFVASHPRQY